MIKKVILSLFTFFYFTKNVDLKYVEGHLKTFQNWAFLTRFCFLSEDGQFEYKIEYNVEQGTPNLLLYYDSEDQWPAVYKKDVTCQEKESVLRIENNQLINLTVQYPFNERSGCRYGSFITNKNSKKHNNPSSSTKSIVYNTTLREFIGQSKYDFEENHNTTPTVDNWNTTLDYNATDEDLENNTLYFTSTLPPTPYTVKKYRTTMRDVELGSIVLTCHSARRFRSARERWWFIAVSNCYNNKGINIKYQFRLTNGLIGDYWHEHFSADEFYVLPILMFYMVIYSFMFMLIILCSIQLKSRQLLHSTYKLFMFSVQLQYVGIVVQTMAMLKYATNGMGYPKLKTFGTVMTAASEVCFLLLLLLLAKGFTITRGRLPISESINLTMFMCFYTIIYSALFIYEEKVFDPGEVLYLYESPAGYGLMVLRIVAWCIFIYSTICTLQHYSEKSNFYYPFNVCGTLWFISGPAFILTANAYIDKWVRESIVCAVLLFIAFGGHFMFMLLTLPSYANKNFPYHVRTTQIGIMEVATISGNSTIDHFGHSVYGPARDDELEQSIIIPLTQRTEELAEMHNNQSSAYDVFTVSQTGVTPSAPNLFTERKSKRNKLFTIENNLDEVRINNTINRFTVTTSMSNLRSETKDT